MAGAFRDHFVVLLGSDDAIRVPQVYQALALCTLLGWPMLMFNYLHDRMQSRISG